MVRLRHLSIGIMGMAAACGLAALSLAPAAEPPRKIDPTFLRRFIPDVAPKPMDVTTDSCQYKPLFGAGDNNSSVVRGVARFGEMSIAPGGSSKPVNYPAEEQVYVIMDGAGVLHYGSETSPVRKHDFMYLPAGVEHSLSNPSAARLDLFVMGFKIPPDTPPPPKLMISNYDDIRDQTVSGHPDTVTYKLLMGNTNSKRDRLAAAHVLTSLFVMDFQPGGTNFPHHHEAEEEIYVLLDGTGEMVAGSGMDGVEARFPARPGDAYFFRLNCTVGFYNSNRGAAHILAVRSLFPRRR
jgi:mannose-6-phosphate isomerase-like protein (cupin superfamily)